MARLKREAAALGCAKLVLDTPLTNVLGHRFYYRNGLLASALRFTRRWHERAGCFAGSVPHLLHVAASSRGGARTAAPPGITCWRACSRRWGRCACSTATSAPCRHRIPTRAWSRPA